LQNANNYMQSFIILTPTVSNTCTAALILIDSEFVPGNGRSCRSQREEVIC